MNCSEIQEMLDAYALGAAERGEAREVESHIADCLRCWSELSKAQQTAALLALAVPIEEPSPDLRERLMAAARRDVAGIRAERSPGLLRRLRLGWGVAAGGFAAVSVAAVFFAAQMQAKVSDLEDENAVLRSEMRSTTLGLERQLARTGQQLAQQAILFTVISDQDSREVLMTSDKTEGTLLYRWSPGTGKGFVECNGLPPLQPGKVYQLWVVADRQAYAMNTFQPQNGWCQIPMDLTFLPARLSGIGISIEDIPGGIDKPADGWVMYEHFD